jgi:hypothetical protein
MAPAAAAKAAQAAIFAAVAEFWAAIKFSLATASE